MIDTQPLVTIGLPTYNRAQTLRRSIESVIAQDYAHWELTISDNGSADETEALCHDFCARDSRIHYTRQPENLGATNNFIAVLKQARGEYFMWLADDDWLADNFLSRCAAALQEYPNCVLVCGRVEYYRGTDLVEQSQSANIDADSPAQRVIDYYATVNDNSVMYGLMRRSALSTTPMPCNVVGGDWLFMASVAFQGRLHTIETTCLKRSKGGASDSFIKTAAVLRLGWFQAYHPYFCIAYFAYKKILDASPVYRTLGQKGRRQLARKCAAVILRRFVPRYYVQTFINLSSANMRRLAPQWFYALMQSHYRRFYRLLRAIHRKRQGRS